MPSLERSPIIEYNFSLNAAMVCSCCVLSDSTKALPSSHDHPWMVSILLRAMMNGVLYCLRILIDSMVWGISPSLMSMTRTAISARDPPLALKVMKEWCPGVSMKSRPGTSNLFFPIRFPQTL